VDIEVPSNSACGFVTAVFAVVAGFALVWHIWWLAIGDMTGGVLAMFIFGWTERRKTTIAAEELVAFDDRQRTAVT
jgi:cytochrome o ubiquinol oxidase subunit 1